MEEKKYRLGIDIGGTFTDLTVLDPQNGRILGLKAPTVAGDPVQGVMNGLSLLSEKGIHPSDIDYFVHGTTIGLNTLLQRKGAAVALLVTEGFRDILNLQRLRLPVPYDFRSRLPEPLVPRKQVFTVRERVLHDGTIKVPIDFNSLDEAIDRALAAGVTGVVVCFLHSYKNPVHEQIAAERIRSRAGGRLEVCLSSALWPQMREYERAVMAAVNLYIQPNVQRYFETLKQRLSAGGMKTTPFITQSNGGIMDVETAAQAPVRTLFSGPAAGVIGAVRVAQTAGFDNVITFDMGGTSADISIIENGMPSFVQSNHIAGFPIILPSVFVHSIGAGGGSYAWIDEGGLLKVGPESVGSEPGPACYGRGDKAALTDAFLLCGYFNPQRFAAGQVTLYPELSAKAMRPIAEHLQLDVRASADRMIQVALANMYAELSSVMEQYGLDPRDFALLAFGGAGPVMASFLADEIQVPCVLVPPSPGTLCALGALTADFVYDAVQSRQSLLSDLPMAELKEEYAALAKKAAQWLQNQEIAGLEGQTLFFSMDARYRGQAYEIELPLEPSVLEDADHGRVLRAFHELHQRKYGHSDWNAPVEVMTLRARLVGYTVKPVLPRVPDADGEAVPFTYRNMVCRGEEHVAPVYSRTDLRHGHRIEGPAIVEQDDTTVVILAGWHGNVDAYGNLVLRRSKGE